MQWFLEISLFKAIKKLDAPKNPPSKKQEQARKIDIQ